MPWEEAREQILRNPAPHLLTKGHLALMDEVLEEADAPGAVVDWSRIPPGCASLEVISRQLLEKLHADFSESTFLLFCHLNAARVTEYVSRVIEVGALPLAEGEVTAEVFSTLHLYLHRSIARGLDPRRVGLSNPKCPTYALLYNLVDHVIQSAVKYLSESILPSRTRRKIAIEPGSKTLESSITFLSDQRYRISEGLLADWVGLALMRMDGPSRRLIFLRDQRGSTLESIAETVGGSAFEVGLALRSARIELQNQLLQILAAHQDPERVAQEKPTHPLSGDADHEDSVH